MTARLALVVATVMISATTAFAQRADSLRIGARVRGQPIHRPPPQVAGEVVAVDSVGLTLKDSHGSPQFGWTSLPIPGCPDIVQCRKRPSAGSQAPAAAR